jgi:ATP-binding cassette subfamily F protein uup
VVSGHRGTTLSPSDKRLLESFWFGGELPWARVGTLSGGERRRLQLLKVLSQRPNVLLLDEPTNDLDLDTLRSLEEYLEDWPGTLVTVSHDRTFLERITTRVVACQDGEVREISGGLATWLSQAINIKDPDPKGEDSSSSKSQPPQRTKTQKSLSTLQFQLNKLDRQIAELTAKRDNILIQFNETTDHNELARLGNELTSLQSDLTEVEDRWLKTLEAIEGYGQY